VPIGACACIDSADFVAPLEVNEIEGDMFLSYYLLGLVVPTDDLPVSAGCQDKTLV
jgi:hypothetical protein